MKLPRRDFLATLSGAGLACAFPSVRAEALPDTVKILAGFAAGGTIDVTARRLADKLRDVIAKSVVVRMPMLSQFCW